MAAARAQRIHNECTVTTYQCYRNGTTLEPTSSRNFTVVWSGKNTPADRVNCVDIYKLPGDPKNYTFTSYALYEEEGDYARLIGKDGQARLYLLQPPFQSEAYYFNEAR
ncbi:hypothetical protein V5799_020711 [Amblyomma americanum]|uniref:Uncharacterized protein n=1 Tax=Amblyomma americanum TaxID=6943 RepID=A0AAQ4ET29_AMBAM